MFERISLKDIVAMNNQFDHGQLVNGSSLRFALDRANKSGSWLRACAYLVRAILIDHAFEEGNKRTAAAVVVGFFEEQNVHYHPENIARSVTSILTKNLTSLTEIEQVIKNAII